MVKNLNIADKPNLRVDASDANIRVDTWDRNVIEARVTTKRYKIGEHGMKIDEHQNGDQVELGLRFPHHVITIQFGNYGVDIVIHMPRQGRMNLHTGDGSIEVGNFKGEMDLETGDGHQEINSVDGTLKARSGDGRIIASGRFDGLRLDTGDGRIEARVQTGSTMASS